MPTTPKTKNLKSFAWIVLAILVLLEVCSVAALGSILIGRSSSVNRTYISLTEGSEISTVNVGTISARKPQYYAGTLSSHHAASPALLDSNTGFQVKDKDKVWSTSTDVEIFSIKYDNNGDAHFTTVSGNGDKVIAPGTGGEYAFSLQNTGDKSLDYTLTVEAYFKGTDQVIPVVARMINDSGYVIGGENSWPEVMKLNDVSEQGVIAAGKVRDYTIQWQWPFERGSGKELEANDAFDTCLGNTAVVKDQELHVIIKTTATLDDNPNRPGGHAATKTGDSSNLTTWAVTGIADLIALAAVIFVLAEKYKLEKARKDKNNAC